MPATTPSSANTAVTNSSEESGVSAPQPPRLHAFSNAPEDSEPSAAPPLPRLDALSNAPEDGEEEPAAAAAAADAPLSLADASASPAAAADGAPRCMIC